MANRISNMQVVSADIQAPAIATCSLWTDATMPAVASVMDTRPTYLELKFRAKADGLRVHNGPQNAGMHVGTRRTATISKCFSSTHTNGRLTTFANSTAAGNGMFAPNAFALPTRSRKGASSRVDAVAYPSTTDRSSVAGASGTPSPEAGSSTGAPIETPRPQDGGGGGTLPTGTAGQELQTTALDPTETQAASADVQAAAADATIFSASATPATLTDPDSSPVQLGVKFRASVAGAISGIRFYKGPQNTGSHVGSLWTATGQRLASVTFANETASGWQQATFSSPVSIAAGTTYIASYHAPVGKYSVNENYFTTAVTNGPLEALASGTSGGNGVYAYGASTAFPTNTFNASNYWVDVVFNSATG
jgi:hypothetical protein